MFESDANEIFKKAGVNKLDAPEFYAEIKHILAEKMANLSVFMGLSMKRVNLYEEQKEALIEDLKKFKGAKTLR